MRRILSILVVVIFCASSVSGQSLRDYFKFEGISLQSEQNATMTFVNQSDYTMTIKVLHIYGGLYRTIVLDPWSRSVVRFSQSSSYKLKIKAVHNKSVSYHDGGDFKVTCNDYEVSRGTMEFRMATYGSGLGPTISAKEFESNE